MAVGATEGCDQPTIAYPRSVLLNLLGPVVGACCAYLLLSPPKKKITFLLVPFCKVNSIDL